MKSLSKSPNHHLNTSSVGFNQSFTGSFQKASARDRSQVPTIEQALAEKLKAFSDLQLAQKEVNTHIFILYFIDATERPRLLYKSSSLRVKDPFTRDAA